jgi:hypothetical protein
MDGNEGNTLHHAMREFTRELRFLLRNTSRIRQGMLRFLLAKTPAESIAMVLVDSAETFETFAINRRFPSKPVRISKAMVDRVYRGETAIMSPVDHLHSATGVRRVSWRDSCGNHGCGDAVSGA